MAQRSLDLLGVGLRCGPTGYTLVRAKCRCSTVAHADQGDAVFSAINGYLAAARGFARLRPAALAPPEASQPDAAESTHTHSGVTRSPCNLAVAPQSRRNHQRHRLRRCRKLSLGSVDSGIELDAPAGLRDDTNNTESNMRVGKVMLMLTMGHGQLPAQALAEPAMPGAQFVQHMAPVPVVAYQPGDAPLDDQGRVVRRPLTAAQINRRRWHHQRRAQRQREARRIQGLVADQLEATRPACTHCGAKLWLPGHLNTAMQPWCVKTSCDGLPEDTQLAIQYLLSDEATPEERGVLQRKTGDGHQAEQRVVTSTST